MTESKRDTYREGKRKGMHGREGKGLTVRNNRAGEVG